MMKVQQKISGSFRSWDRAKIFCKTRGISTGKKNSISVIEAIQVQKAFKEIHSFLVRLGILNDLDYILVLSIDDIHDQSLQRQCL